MGVPGPVAADLVVIQAGFVLHGLQALLDRPPRADGVRAGQHRVPPDFPPSRTGRDPQSSPDWSARTVDPGRACRGRVPDGKQRLLRTAEWDIDGVLDDLRGYVMQHLGDDVTGVFTVDETGFISDRVCPTPGS